MRLPTIVLLASAALAPAVLAGCGGSGDADTAPAATSPAVTTSAARQAAPEPVCSSNTHKNGTKVTAWVVRVVNELPAPVSLRATDWTCGNWWFHHLVPSQFDGAVAAGGGGAVENTLMKASKTPGFALVVSNEAGAEIGRFAINQVEKDGIREGLVSVGGSPFGLTATMPGGAASGGVPVMVSSDGRPTKTTVTLAAADAQAAGQP
jgi:hypothetical protein